MSAIAAHSQVDLLKAVEAAIAALIDAQDHQLRDLEEHLESLGRVEFFVANRSTLGAHLLLRLNVLCRLLSLTSTNLRILGSTQDDAYRGASRTRQFAYARRKQWERSLVHGI